MKRKLDDAEVAGYGNEPDITLGAVGNVASIEKRKLESDSQQYETGASKASASSAKKAKLEDMIQQDWVQHHKVITRECQCAVADW